MPDLSFATLLGRRWYLSGLVLAGLAVLAIEYTSLGGAFFDLVSRKATADNAAALQLAIAQEKAALAMKAAEDARRAAAEAETARQVALNSPERQTGEAKKAEGEGAVAIARSPYADDLAKQELRIRAAEADAKEAEAVRARAEAARAAAEEQRAKVAAAKDLVDCKQNGFILGYMTGEGCDVPTADGHVPTDRERNLATLKRLGYEFFVPDTAGWLPVGRCRDLSSEWTTGVKKRAGFGAFAIAKDGNGCAGNWGKASPDIAIKTALMGCGSPEGNNGKECRILVTFKSPGAAATEDASSATSAPPRNSSPSNLATVLPPQLNVHSAPNADAGTVIGKLARGQTVRITGPGAGDFVAIESNCIDGNPCKGYINGRAEFISH